MFGNPPLGTTFLSSNPASGLDWPVRLLVHQDANGDVWAVYTDFQWIARRHRIEDRTKEFEMASQVIAAITSSVQSEITLRVATGSGLPQFPSGRSRSLPSMQLNRYGMAMSTRRHSKRSQVIGPG